MKTKNCYNCHKNLTLGCFSGQRTICKNCALRNQQKKADIAKPSLVSVLLKKWRRYEAEEIK